MKGSLLCFVLAVVLCFAFHLEAPNAAQAQTVKGPDERFKTDILVVVAHPDDEGGVTPYLARAIYDEHKRVAVVFATRGGSGGNDYSREHGPALADIREQEARQACAKLGITNVWFLDGKDTASQNVLNSLANWGHGVNLEALVRIVRLTRPEVIISWLPGIFIGENHGDHQAAGVLATEAFDMAGDSTAFPEQVAGATKRLEVYLENLTPWQPKKLYFFSDADDQKQFTGAGPAYSVKEISPSQKKPYWRLAMDAATPHLTQFPTEIHQLTSMSDAQLNKFMEDPQHQWWTEPMTLIFGKAAVAAKPTDDIFAISAESASPNPQPFVGITNSSGGPANPIPMIGGPWEFFDRFRSKHGLWQVPVAKEPEIGVKSGTTVVVPIHILRHVQKSETFTVTTDTPPGWKAINGTGVIEVGEGTVASLRVEVQTPEITKEQLKAAAAQTITVHVSKNGTSIGDVHLKVMLLSGGVPQ
jgi:LmbE family N-acetylglucosaminyl deacetylase